MTEKEWDALKEGQKIKILHPLERGRVTRVFKKYVNSSGKGLIVGNIFYRLKDIELVKGQLSAPSS